MEKEKINYKDLKFSNWIRNFYNIKAKKISDKGYEYARWFSTKEKRRQYRFSTISLIYHLRDIEFKNCLEIGCGPGTWTKLLLKRYPEAKFTCLDISQEMIKQFKNSINSKKIKIIINNFLEQNFKNKFDFIFCSRAIDYIPNKEQVIMKLFSLLNPGGKVIIVTSPPHPIPFAIKKFITKRVNLQHTRRISVRDMAFLLRKNNFINIKFYPVLFTDFFLVPTEFLFRHLYKESWGVLSKIFATSYIVKFKKPK